MENNKQNGPKIYAASGDEGTFNDFFKPVNQNSVRESYVCNENIGEPQPKSQRNDILNTNLPTMQSAKKSHKFDIDEIKCKLWWVFGLLGLVGLSFTIAGCLLTYWNSSDNAYEWWGMTGTGIFFLLLVIIFQFEQDEIAHWIGFILCLFLGLLFIIIGVLAAYTCEKNLWFWFMIVIGIILIIIDMFNFADDWA